MNNISLYYKKNNFNNIFNKMCFNENVSLLTYLTGLSGSAALLTQNKIPESLFYGWVVQMQLVDYFLWKNQPCKITKNNKICNKDEILNCNKMNNATTAAGIIINHLEPLILFGGIMLFSNKTLPNPIIILFCIFMIIISLYTIDIFTYKDKSKCTTVTKESNPHLHWKWNGGEYSFIVYLLFLIVLILLSYYGLENGYINAFIILIGFIISKYIYGNKRSTGAMWCFIAAFAPWLLFFLYKI